jgi:hypothetical protein
MPRLYVILLLCLWSVLAYAGPKDDAIAKRKSGDKLMAQGDFDDALKAYEEAKTLFADPEFDLARAEALLKLRRYDEAKAAYQTYLDTSKNNKSKNDVKKAIVDIERILKTSLSCQSDPTGAVVYLNSRVDGEVGPAPITFNLPPGTHRIIFIKEGFRIKSETITINEGEAKTISTKLEIAPYTVDVTTTPGNAAIFVDGAEKSKSPSQVELSEGPHTIELKLDGYQTLSQKLEGKAGEKLSLAHAFVENPSQLLVITEPSAQGTVEVTGREQRGSINAPLALPPGKYNVVVKANGFKDAATVVNIERAKTTEAKLTLEPYPVKFSIKASQPSFTLLIDGQPQTLSGNLLEVAPGVHKVQIEAPNQNPYVAELNFTPAEDLNLDVTFKLQQRNLTKRMPLIIAGAGASWLIFGVGSVLAADQDATAPGVLRTFAAIGDVSWISAAGLGAWYFIRRKQEGPSKGSITKTPAAPQGNQ